MVLEKLVKYVFRVRPAKATQVFRLIRDMPYKQRYLRMREALVMTILRFSYRLIDEYGEEGLNIVEDIFSRNYGDYLSLTIDLFNVRERDARTVASIIAASDTLLGVESKFVEYTPSRCVRRISYCPIYSYSKRMGRSDEEVYLLCRSIMQGMCVSAAKALNRNVSYRYSRWLAKGDPYCEEIIETRD